MAGKINYAKLYTLRSDGRYQGYWRDAEGKRHTVCDRDPERLHQKISDKEAPKALTFREIADAWKDAVWEDLRPGTQASYGARHRAAVEELGDRPAAEVEAKDIYAHLKRLSAQDYSISTIRAQRTVYKMIFERAVIDRTYGKEVKVNPVMSVPIPPKTKPLKKRDAPDEETIRSVIEHCKDAPFGLFAMFLLFTGFRRGEALAVRWQDIDLDARTITCSGSIQNRTAKPTREPTKTKAGIREVPLLPGLAAVVERPKDARPSDYLFHAGDPAQPMTMDQYRRSWTEYCRYMGFGEQVKRPKTGHAGKKYTANEFVPNITAHCFRHGYATMLHDADVDPYAAKRLLGHADIQTTLAIYTHLSRLKNSESMQKLEEYAARRTLHPTGTDH